MTSMMLILVSAASQRRQFAWITGGTITKNGTIAVDDGFFGRVPLATMQPLARDPLGLVKSP